MKARSFLTPRQDFLTPSALERATAIDTAFGYTGRRKKYANGGGVRKAKY